MSCPYSDEELEKWDSVANPMGEPCHTCDEVDCVHNENLEVQREWEEGWCPVCGDPESVCKSYGGHKMEHPNGGHKMEHPKIEFEGKTYFQVGCRKCQKGEDWNFYSDGKRFVAQCKCGNTLVIKQGVTQDKPDEKPIDMRMVV